MKLLFSYVYTKTGTDHNYGHKVVPIVGSPGMRIELDSPLLDHIVGSISKDVGAPVVILSISPLTFTL